MISSLLKAGIPVPRRMSSTASFMKSSLRPLW